MTNVMDNRAALVVVLIGLFALGSVIGFVQGVKSGANVTRTEAASESRETTEREDKIMAVIVKKNPNATIREFSGFPKFLIEESAKRGLDYRYVMAIIETESEWNPRAVSPVGAIGLMQVMPATGALVAKNAGIQFEGPKGKELGSLADPRQNLVIGLTHLKGLIDSYGLGPIHLRAYNRGDVAAREYRPGDRYAEDVALRFVRLSMLVPQ